jgi:hypothetical protein
VWIWPKLLEAICDDPYLLGYFVTRIANLAMRYSGKGAAPQTVQTVLAKAQIDMFGSKGAWLLIENIKLHKPSQQYDIGGERSARVLGYLLGADYVNDPEAAIAITKHESMTATWPADVVTAWLLQPDKDRERIAVASGLERIYWHERIAETAGFSQAIAERNLAFEERLVASARQR